jgi:hypothetical protein
VHAQKHAYTQTHKNTHTSHTLDQILSYSHATSAQVIYTSNFNLILQREREREREKRKKH